MYAKSALIHGVCTYRGVEISCISLSPTSWHSCLVWVPRLDELWGPPWRLGAMSHWSWTPLGTSIHSRQTQRSPEFPHQNNWPWMRSLYLNVAVFQSPRSIPWDWWLFWGNPPPTAESPGCGSLEELHEILQWLTINGAFGRGRVQTMSLFDSRGSGVRSGSMARLYQLDGYQGRKCSGIS